jgi:hypothetical protein
MVLEFGAKTIPSLIYLVTGTTRLCQINHIGVTHYRFSTQFTIKLILSISMAVLLTCYIVLTFSLADTTVRSSWINSCSQDMYSLLYGVQAAAWGLGSFVMLAEYKRSLKEAWFANKLFWFLNLAIEITILALLHEEYANDWFMIITASFNLLINLTLLLLACKTDVRIKRNRKRY